MAKTLQKRIMRGVYYAYGLSLIVDPMFRRGIVLAVLLGVFSRFVSVSAVVHNLSMIPIVKIGDFFLEATMHTESWTLALLCGIVFLGYLSYRDWRKVRVRSFRFITS